MRSSSGDRSALSIESNGSAAFAMALLQRLLARLDDAARLLAPALGPAFLAEQRNEAHVGEVFAPVVVFGDAGDAHQFLRARIAADRDHQAAADLELRAQRFRNLRPAGRHHDGVIGRMIGPAARAVAVQHVHIVVALLGERRGRFFRQLPDALDRVDLGRDFGEHGGRVAGAGADFEHLFPAFEPQRLGHERDDVGLRDGLPLGDRQRANLRRRIPARSPAGTPRAGPCAWPRDTGRSAPRARQYDAPPSRRGGGRSRISVCVLASAIIDKASQIRHPAALTRVNGGQRGDLACRIAPKCVKPRPAEISFQAAGPRTKLTAGA